MAKHEKVYYTDDLDGTEGAAPFTFGVEGKWYTIDLAEANRNRLQEALAPFLAEAKPVAGERAATRRAGRPASGKSSANEIRIWAREQGMEVSERGRVKDEIRQAYEAAHS